MFTKHYFLLLTVIALFSCERNNDQEDILDFMGRDKESLSYKVCFYEKPFFESDTTKITFDVLIRKNENDTLYGYDFKIYNKNLNLLYYNVENELFLVDSLSNTFYKIRKFQSNLKEFIIPNLNLSENYLSDPEVLLDITKNDITITKNHDDSNDITNVKEVFRLFSKPNHSITYILTAEFQNMHQFHKYEFNEIDYKASSINIDNQIAELGEKYTLRDVSSKGISSIKDKNIKNVPNFTGLLLSDSQGKPIDFESFNNKIIIVDYWYMACYPCIKMIPFLNELYEKYSEHDIEIIGVNIKDNNSQKINSLKRFIEYNEVKYPVFLTDQNPLDIEEYPTVIILNQKRNVIYVSTGYSKEKEKEILNSIEKELML